jgi:hypothetical protein
VMRSARVPAPSSWCLGVQPSVRPRHAGSERDKTAVLLVVRRDATERLCRPSPSVVPPCLGGHCWWRCRLSSGRGYFPVVAGDCSS